MTMLAKARIRGTGVYVLNPDYVRTHAQKMALGRASWLYFFSNDFDASGRGVYVHVALRGVRREDVARSAAQESEVPPSPSARTAPKIEEVLRYATSFVPKEQKEEFTAGLRKLWPQ